MGRNFNRKTLAAVMAILAACWVVPAVSPHFAFSSASPPETGRSDSPEVPAFLRPFGVLGRHLSRWWAKREPRAFYVSPEGSDAADGTSEAPLKGLRRAVSMLRAGDTLYLLPGTYAEESDFQASGTAKRPITVQGLGAAVIDGSRLKYYSPAFDTQGHSRLVFRNLEVRNARAGVQVSPGSRGITIDGLRTTGSQFAVKISGASGVTIRNASAVNSRNAFRSEGASRGLRFENVSAFGSRDVYEGYDPNYLNGDGFILESDTRDVVIRNAVSGDHWDAGFDIKASDVLIENIVAFGSKNGLKLWGKDIVVKNALIFEAKSQPLPGGKSVDGNGVNVRQGDSAIVNATFVDNEAVDIKVGTDRARLNLVDCVVARKRPGTLLVNKGRLDQSGMIWFDARWPEKPQVDTGPGGRWADPGFRAWDDGDFRPLPSGPAARRGAPSEPFAGAAAQGAPA